MKWFKAVVVLILCYVTFCLVMFPDACITAVSGALKLCVTAVIPTLFPFFVCQFTAYSVWIRRIWKQVFERSDETAF